MLGIFLLSKYNNASMTIKPCTPGKELCPFGDTVTCNTNATCLLLCPPTHPCASLGKKEIEQGI